MRTLLIFGWILFFSVSFLFAGGTKEPAPVKKAPPVKAEIEQKEEPQQKDPSIVTFPGPKNMSYQELVKYYYGFPEMVGQAMHDTVLPLEKRQPNFSFTFKNGTVVISGAHEVMYYDNGKTKVKNGVLAEPATVTIGGYPVPLAAGQRLSFSVDGYMSQIYLLGEDTVLPGNYFTLKYAAGTPIRMWHSKCVRMGILADTQQVKFNLLPGGTFIEFTEEDDLIRPQYTIQGLVKEVKLPKPTRLKGYKYDLLFTEAEIDEKGYVAAGKLAEPFSSAGMNFAPGDIVEFHRYQFDDDNGDSGDPMRNDYLEITHLPMGEPINLAAANEENRIMMEKRRAEREAEEAKRPKEYVYEGVKYVGKILFHPNGQFWGGDLVDDSNVRGYLFKAGERVSFNEDGSLNTGILVNPTTIQGLLLYDQVRFYPSGNLREGKLYTTQTVRGESHRQGTNLFFKDGELK